jgi:beta-phosphoglucomutase-like phosphatase (HAD superfamily)
MTPTREDYEAAAKAAGIEKLWFTSGTAYHWPVSLSGGRKWNPLYEAYDSQDLQCRLDCDIVRGIRHVVATKHPGGRVLIDHDGTLEDRKRALREAIFKLAAEIGRGRDGLR